MQDWYSCKGRPSHLLNIPSSDLERVRFGWKLDRGSYLAFRKVEVRQKKKSDLFRMMALMCQCNAQKLCLTYKTRLKGLSLLSSHVTLLYSTDFT